MFDYSLDDVRRKIERDNHWWQAGAVDARFADLPRRDYFEPLIDLIEGRPRRSVVLMGPRRVGKTVMLHQAVQRLIDEGVEPRHILMVSLDAPVFGGIGLDRFVWQFAERCGLAPGDRFYAFFDEVQYLDDWERHLKSVHDAWHGARFVVSGSAAAALRRISRESGAGRFTDFSLPPLTFREFLALSDRLAACGLDGEPADDVPPTLDLAALNGALVDYVNFGGFPEAAIEARARTGAPRFVARDVVEKVLLRDLPSLYGISDLQELNRFFAHLAYNTGQEVSLDELARRSAASKNTLRRYIEYLEAAFLIRVLDRIDRSGRRFQRRTHFKVYVTNPGLRAALFSPVDADDPAMGAMVETALMAQWDHEPSGASALAYARWKGGHEVDLVGLRLDSPRWATEVKWSDRFVDHPRQLEGLIRFAAAQSDPGLDLLATTRSRWGETQDPAIRHVPAAWQIYLTGLQTARRRAATVSRAG